MSQTTEPDNRVEVMSVVITVLVTYMDLHQINLACEHMRSLPLANDKNGAAIIAAIQEEAR